MEQCTRRAAFNEQTFLQINFASCSNPEKGATRCHVSREECRPRVSTGAPFNLEE